MDTLRWIVKCCRLLLLGGLIVGCDANAQPPLVSRAPLASATTLALPTATPAPTSIPTATPAPTSIPTATPIIVNGTAYDAYIVAASKTAQEFQYSCEFDAAWVIMQTYEIEASVADLIALMPIDRSLEPTYVETATGFVIYGGDILTAYSGDYTQNFLARSTGGAMGQVFAQYGLRSTPVHDRAGVEAALLADDLVWMKTTVDFKEWRDAVWIMPDGRTHQTVLGNDHAVVVMGFNAAGVVIRDVLGPTSSNEQRPYEYSVDWDWFMQVWAAQSLDGLVVHRPE